MSYLLSTDAFIAFVSGDTAIENVLSSIRATDAQISVISVAHYRAAIRSPKITPLEQTIHTANLDNVVHKAKSSRILRDVDLEVAEKYAELRAMELKSGGKPLTSELLLVLATALRYSLILITPMEPWVAQLKQLGLQIRTY